MQQTSSSTNGSYDQCGCLQLNEAGTVTNQEIAKELCLPPVKLHCSSKPVDFLQSAVITAVICMLLT